MIEETVLNYLKSKVNVPVYTEMPENTDGEFILVEKTGSAEENFVESATIVLQSYADSMYAAAMLNKKTKAAMKDIIELDSISKSKLNSDYNFTDTTKKKYRYQAVYDLIY